MQTAPRILTWPLNPTSDRTLYVPHFQTGTVNPALGSQSHPGGKGANMASNLAGWRHSLATAFALGALTRVGSCLPSTTEIEALMHQVSIEPFDPEKEV
jgi:fructose-1-phosphate kinase PfkB-like protein